MAEPTHGAMTLGLSFSMYPVSLQARLVYVSGLCVCACGLPLSVCGKRAIGAYALQCAFRHTPVTACVTNTLVALNGFASLT